MNATLIRTPRWMLLAAAAALVATASALAQSAAPRTIAIKSPLEDETIHSNTGDVPVEVTVAPRLAPKEAILIKLDDREAARGAGSRLQLTGIERGTHRLQAVVVDAQGKPVAQSRIVTFHVWQASRLFPARKN